MRFLIFISAITSLLASCGERSAEKDPAAKNAPSCTEECRAKNKSTELSCGLSSPEMHKRKETVLASLKKQVIAQNELPDGFAFKFRGSDKILDELTEFIKTERECCHFFTFGLSVSGDKSEIWLQLTGIEGTKDFIINELELTK